MIFYFSGTGNSKFIAEKLAKILEDDIFSINDFYKNNFCTSSFGSLEITSSGPYIFVSPTYAWRLPKIVQKFIENVNFTKNQAAYFIQTCSSEVGNSAHYAKRLCDQVGLKYMGLAAIVMPENYLALFPTPDQEESLELIRKALQKVPAIAKTIRNQQMLEVEPELTRLGLLSHLVNPLFYPFVVKAKKFHYTAKCISCGKCAEVCPLNNVKLENNKPTWAKNCTHCMACIAYCPVEAIEYGKVSRKRKRYTLEKTLQATDLENTEQSD